MRLVICILFAILIAASIHAATIHVPADQPTTPPIVAWQVHLGFPNVNDYGENVIETADTSFVFLGRTQSATTGLFDLVLAKVTKWGDTLWQRQIGLPSGSGIGYDILQTADGGFAVCGGITYEADTCSVLLMRFDSAGSTLWSRRMCGVRQPMAFRMVSTDSRGFCMAGCLVEEEWGRSRAAVWLTDSLGNVQWTTLLGVHKWHSGVRGITRCSDGGFMVAGSMDIDGSQQLTPFVAKINGSGSVLWQKTYAVGIAGQTSIGSGICSTQDSGFVIVGQRGIAATGRTSEAYILKVNQLGDSLWMRTFSDPDLNTSGDAVVEGINGDLTLSTGISSSPHTAFLHNLSSEGDENWSCGLSSDIEEAISSLRIAYDGGLLLASTVGAWAGRQLDILAIKYTSQIPSVSSFLVDSEVSPLHLTTHSPVFSWSFASPIVGPQDSIQLDVCVDTLWSQSIWTIRGPFGDDHATYSGLALSDGERYYVRFRIAQQQVWSPWYHTSFRMNSVPTVPGMVRPANNDVAPNLPFLIITNSSDAENDALSYDFEVYGDSALTQLEWQGLNIPPTGGNDTTIYQVGTLLTENARHWWRVRAYDAYEYSGWSTATSFWMNAIEEPPRPFALISPPDTSGGPEYNLLPTLLWQASSDPDPYDTVRYKLEVSLTPTFAFVFAKDSLLRPQFTLTDSLFFATHYWWRVTAKDRTGHAITSPIPNDFWTWTLGDLNYSHLCDLSDLSAIVSYLTGGGYVISPKMVGDVSGDCMIDLTDLSYIVNHLTGGGVQLKVGCE